MARKLNQRLAEIKAAECLAHLNYRYLLIVTSTGDREGKFAVDLFSLTGLFLNLENKRLIMILLK